MADRATLLQGVFTGKTGILKEEGHPSAIVKTLVHDRLTLTKLGLDGDEQADRSMHGGPERALHQYPPEHYRVWKAEFPRHAEKFQPGTFGENISAPGWSEENVRIGDVFRIGTAIVEVSQPRTPCWKLNHRFEIATLAKRVQETGSSGWFFRVIEPGELQLGDACTLIRPALSSMTLKAVWDVYLAHRPDLDLLRTVRDLPALAATWKRTLDSRIDWLARNATSG
ncbi:MAG: MOSC domain-containing protein [Gammaproteobacteria bacterium]